VVDGRDGFEMGYDRDRMDWIAATSVKIEAGFERPIKE